MAREKLTEELVEHEIKLLQESEYVKLAVKETRLRNRRRQRLYQLRCYEKRGRELAEAGYTMANLDEKIQETEAMLDGGEP